MLETISIQVVKRMFLRGHLYQAAFPQGQFQIPAPNVASHADVLMGSSHVPTPQTSADLSGKKRRPITANFQIWEVHFGPCEMSRDSKKDQKVSSHTFKTNYSYELTHKFSY